MDRLDGVDGLERVDGVDGVDGLDRVDRVGRLDGINSVDRMDGMDKNGGFPIYILKLWLDPEYITEEIRNLYLKMAIDRSNIISRINTEYDKFLLCSIDAGIDLFVPVAYSIGRVAWAVQINHGIKASMEFAGIPSGFYLYSRSSTASKTPLRLSNSVGIIDAGYRGHLIGMFDNVESRDSYEVTMGQRLVQICAPDITYPIHVEIVNDINELGVTQRGIGGIGSTGK